MPLELECFAYYHLIHYLIQKVSTGEKPGFIGSQLRNRELPNTEGRSPEEKTLGVHGHLGVSWNRPKTGGLVGSWGGWGASGGYSGPRKGHTGGALPMYGTARKLPHNDDAQVARYRTQSGCSDAQSFPEITEQAVLVASRHQVTLGQRQSP